MSETLPSEAHFELSFRDPRPPREIQLHFERTLLALFRPAREGAKLVWRGSKGNALCVYSFELRFECAFPIEFCYTFRAIGSWANAHVKYQDYYRQSSQSWFTYWTQPFAPAQVPDPADCSTQLYERAEQQALNAESYLVDEYSVQQAILAAMRNGARFFTAHKEGGSNIRWDGTHFGRYDYGESNDIQTFPDDPTFLAFLRDFYRPQLNLDAIPSPLPEFDAWKLILRLMQYK